MIRKLILAAFACLVTLVFVGLALKLVSASRNHYYVWPPNFHKTFHPDPAILPGIAGPTHFDTNSVGIRGDEFSAAPVYRILTVGGSTTECLYLDQKREWPALVEQKLGKTRVWVGNVGKSGMTSRDHIVQLKYLLPEYPKIDLAIVLVGINDLMLQICDKSYDPDFMKQKDAESEQIAHAFSVTPIGSSLFRNAGLKRFQEQVRQLFYSHRAIQQDDQGKIYAQLRRERKAAGKVVDKLPDMTAALNEYKDNLNQMIDIAQAHHVKIILMTQPSLWKPVMSPEAESLLWKGGIGSDEYSVSNQPGEYYSIKALTEGMKRLNDALLQVCANRDIPCLDLASEIPRTPANFYDDVHFNDHGSEKVADAVVKMLNEAVFHTGSSRVSAKKTAP